MPDSFVTVTWWKGGSALSLYFPSLASTWTHSRRNLRPGDNSRLGGNVSRAMILPVLFIASGAIDVRQNPLLIFPFVIVPAGISIYRLVLIFIHFDLEILLYQDGFRYTHKGTTRNYSWKAVLFLILH